MVDAGKLKERRHNAARGMSILVEDFVSKVPPIFQFHDVLGPQNG